MPSEFDFWWCRWCICYYLLCLWIFYSCFRHKSRRGQAVSYKEDSDEKTDSDDVLEVDNGDSQEAAADTPETTSETIEKVIAQRRGKKGGNVKNFACFGSFLLIIIDFVFLFSCRQPDYHLCHRRKRWSQCRLWSYWFRKYRSSIFNKMERLVSYS